MNYCLDAKSPECALQASCETDGFTADFQCAPAVCDDDVGVWEGAVYSRESYFRARRNCRMRDLWEGTDFCEACALYLRSEIFNYSGAPPYDDTLDACPTPTAQETGGLGVP